MRRARSGGLQASSHEHLDLFQKQLESPSSPPGEDLTAGDIVEDNRMYEGRGEGFDEGEDVEERPLRGAELGVDQRINRQVMITRWFSRKGRRSNRCLLRSVQVLFHPSVSACVAGSATVHVVFRALDQLP